MFADFHGLYREDRKAYPDAAVREALLNSIVHRDYSFHASMLIRIYQDRMEFTSLGGLLPGIQREDLMLGISVCRNRKLADVFYRLELIEAYGTGLLKIRSLYSENRRKPEILTGPNSFKIVLPAFSYDGAGDRRSAYTGSGNVTDSDKIMYYLDHNDSITRAQAEKITDSSSSSAGRLLKGMVDDGSLQKEGRGRRTRYIKTSE